MKTKFKAFTIVELLVVMAVIGILITLAVVGIQALQKSQRETQRMSDIRALSTALTDYYVKRRAYPPDNTWIVLNATDGTVCIYDWPTGYYGGNRGGNGTCNASQVGNAFLKSTTFNSKNAIMNTNYFNGVSIAPTVLAVGGDCETPKGADSWTIYYKTNLGWSGASQQYSLYACTENGLSQNFGELN